jgi:hypothetical protein
VLTPLLLSILRANKVDAVEVVCSGCFALTILLLAGYVARNQSWCIRSCKVMRLMLSKLCANKVPAFDIAC